MTVEWFRASRLIASRLIAYSLLQRSHLYMAVMTMFVVGKIGIALAIDAQTLYVNLRDDHAALHLEAVAHVKHVAVLSDIGATREDDIGSRFANTR